MHAGAAVKTPSRQRGACHRLSGLDICFDGIGSRLPTGRLPGFKRPLAMAEAPANAKIEVARIIGDRSEMISAIMKEVAEGRPHELRLRMSALSQLSELLRGVFQLEDGLDAGVGLGARRHIVLLGHVKYLDLFAFPSIETGAGLLSERAALDQRRDIGRCFVVFVPGIVRQSVFHRLDYL